MSKEHPLRIGFLIHDVSRLRRTAMDKAMKPLGVTRSQYWVISNLTRHNGEGMMQTELANVMNVGKVTLGGLIDRLEDTGYVVRKPDPVDRRAKRIHLTPQGKKLVKKMQAAAERENAKILDGIPENAVAGAEDVLYQMKRRLLEMEEESRANKKR